MATVYRDKRMRNAAGKPAIVINYKGLDGRRSRERTEALTLEEGQAILRRRLTALTQAQTRGLTSLEALKPVTFAGFVEQEFLPHSKTVNRESSYKRKLCLYENVKGPFGNKALPAITVADVEHFIVARLNGKSRKGNGDKPPSPGEVNRERSFLCGALNMAVRRGVIDRNPVLAVKALREDNERDRTLSPAEEERIMGFLAAPYGWLLPIVQVALGTGMRLGEILAIKWADLDRRNGFIRVPHASKAHKPRFVPINTMVAEVLDGISPFVGTDGHSPVVFADTDTETGMAYTVPRVSHAFIRVAEKAGLDDVSFHTLRHTVVSRLVAAGVSERKIMAMIGHSSSSMVKRYTHLAPGDLRGVAEALVREPIPAGFGVSVAKNLDQNVAAL